MSRTITSDLEAQAAEKKYARLPLARAESEYNVPTGTKVAYLSLYFLLNILLTIYNKAMLGKVCEFLIHSPRNNLLTSKKFAYPWLLTTLHTGSASIGCYVLVLRGIFKLTKLSRRDNTILITFSLLFTINIAISNVSL